jgi:hypothetical protein
VSLYIELLLPHAGTWAHVHVLCTCMCAGLPRYKWTEYMKADVPLTLCQVRVRCHSTGQYVRARVRQVHARTYVQYKDVRNVTVLTHSLT